MKSQSIFFGVLITCLSGISAHAQQAAVDWIKYLDGARFEADLSDCQFGSRLNQVSCHVVLEFDSHDPFGGLVGKWDLGLAGQAYEAKFEKLSQSDKPWRLGISNADYTRRVKSPDAEDMLSFSGPPGDLEPLLVKFMVDRTSGNDDLFVIFQRQEFMKQKVYYIEGVLNRK